MRLDASTASSSSSSSPSSPSSSSCSAAVPAKVPKHCRSGVILRGSWLADELVNSQLLVYPACNRVVKPSRRHPIPGTGGAGVQLVGTSGGLERRPDGGAAVALAAAAAAAQQAERHLAVRRDLALDLPPCPTLPDGEERPYGASSRLRIRDYDQESEIYRECIRPPPNRTVHQTTGVLGVASFPPATRVAAPSSAGSLLCCSAPGCCGSTSSLSSLSSSSSSSSSGTGYRNHHVSQRSHHNNHVNYLRSRRKPNNHHQLANQQQQQQQQHEADLDKRPDGPLSARLEAPPAAPLTVMVPSSGKSLAKCVKSLRERVNSAPPAPNQNHASKSRNGEVGGACTQTRPSNNDVATGDAAPSDGWPASEANSRSKLASLTVVSCSSASLPVDGGSPASSGRSSPAKPADAHT